MTTASGESKRQDVVEVLFTTNVICVAVCWGWLFGLPGWAALLALAVLAFTTGFQVWHLRSAKRAYMQRIKEHVQAGGTVMMVRRRGGWHPVPLYVDGEPPLDRP